MSKEMEDLGNRLLMATAQIQSLNQFVLDLTNANVALRANLIMCENANKQLAEKCVQLEAKVAEVPVPPAAPVPAEAAPVEEAAA